MIQYNQETGELFDHKGKPLTADGKEIPDSTPIAPPVGYVKRDSLAEQIRQMVLSERLAQEALAAGAETFAEADDFDIGDDYDPRSPYEANFDPMTREELFALHSQGKDVDNIVPKAPEEKKPKKAKAPDPKTADDDGDPQITD